MSNEIQKNVFGEPLEPCSNEPLTGWFRDGCCNTDKNAVSYTHLTLPTTEYV